ncbi:unnamed protein product, partial [Prorocentrum cordatum]
EEAPHCASCARGASRVFCGGEHTLVRDPETLAVFQLGACGLGFDHDDPSAASRPSAYARRVPLPGPSSAVFAGYYHNLVKLNGGRCLAYGCGRQSPSSGAARGGPQASKCSRLPAPLWSPLGPLGLARGALERPTNDGQLVNGSLSEDTLPVPTRLRFAEAAAGGHHSACRTLSGEAFGGSTGGVVSQPGHYHTAALGEDGEWYVWGCNEQGQLGSGRPGEEQITVPRRLAECAPELQGAQVAAFEGGYGFSLLLMGDGRVLTMGNHSEGQRAVDPDLDEAPPVSQVPLPGPAEAVAAGSHHALAVVGGRVFALGSNEYGQVVGDGAAPGGSEEHREWRPRAVEGLPEGDPVVRVSAGIPGSGKGSSPRSPWSKRTASGRVFLWGCGGNGQTGDGALPASSPVREVDLAEVARRCPAASAADFSGVAE